MQRRILTLIFCFVIFFPATPAKEVPSIYVDKKGVMRWEDTREEASFFGVNYTLPFAHAYRAMGYLNVDRKAAIDRDVYHFARLGFNAYRIHIWDVEISDIEGNLIENDHLDLLDWLIYKLKERDIHIILTAMTNFGNGYPERNQPTGGFSYAYDKCEIHTNPEAIRAQERYIASLAMHVNPYTGKAYKDDPSVVGFEINNEPCHTGTQQQTRDYINRMLAALRKTGNRKPLFYNVSHNMQQIEAYYATGIQGTTYQWYPVGLVSGYARKGNFLPYVDDYHIPFSHVKGFENKARLVYEYDPADIMYSYMHPAMARTFRTAGFQWITQFAYDPMDMAWANTEYQTHFLNLAYTPQKAISMKIAAEVAYSVPRGQSYGTYPADTLFADFAVSYSQDMSMMNTKEKYFYSNHTSTPPVDAVTLKSIAGYGNSPIVQYEGTGAYFIDRLEEGVWRLEVMPDAVPVSDPFAKPSLHKEVVTIAWNNWDMTLRLPALQDDFEVRGINEGNRYSTQAVGGVIPALGPGVYILQRQGYVSLLQWDADTPWNNIRLGEYVAPQPRAQTYTVFHQAATVTESGKPLVIEAQIAGSAFPDSVWIYTDRISFWSDNNPRYPMERIHGYTYRAIIPGEVVTQGKFRYTIIVSRDGNPTTFPAGISGTPLDWDYASPMYWETRVVNETSAISLYSATRENSRIETYTMPEWSRVHRELIDTCPETRPVQRFICESDDENPRFFLRSYVKEEIALRTKRLGKSNTLCVSLQNAPDSLNIGFVTNTGYTYAAKIAVNEKSVYRIPLSELQQTATALLPHPYPVFLKKYFDPVVPIPFRPEDIELLEISFDGRKNEKAIIEIGDVWLE